MKRLMSAAVLALAVCLLIAYPNAAVWALPVYSGLLAWNGQHWLAMAVGLLFVAIQG